MVEDNATPQVFLEPPKSENQVYGKKVVELTRNVIAPNKELVKLYCGPTDSRHRCGGFSGRELREGHAKPARRVRRDFVGKLYRARRLRYKTICEAEGACNRLRSALPLSQNR
jgi:hypothetical protein